MTLGSSEQSTSNCCHHSFSNKKRVSSGGKRISGQLFIPSKILNELLYLQPNQTKIIFNYPLTPKGQKEVSSPADWPGGPSLSQVLVTVLGADVLVIDTELRMIIFVDGWICSQQYTFLQPFFCNLAREDYGKAHWTRKESGSQIWMPSLQNLLGYDSTADLF